MAQQDIYVEVTFMTESVYEKHGFTVQKTVELLHGYEQVAMLRRASRNPQQVKQISDSVGKNEKTVKRGLLKRLGL